MNDLTPDQLVQEWRDIDAKLKAASKQFSDLMKPYKDRQEVIENQLHDFLNKNKLDNIKTENGTAYKSLITTPKLIDRTVFLDWCLEHWESGGGELLQIGAPQITAFKQFMEEHDSSTPPGTGVEFFERINVRKG